MSPVRFVKVHPGAVIPFTALADIYAAIPPLHCKRKCQASCGPIQAYPAERQSFEAATGKKFPSALAVLKSGTMECPELTPLGTCSVYEHRPLICRLWGVVRAMKCPHGCVPDRWLLDDEAADLLKRSAGSEKQ